MNALNIVIVNENNDIINRLVYDLGKEYLHREKNIKIIQNIDMLDTSGVDILILDFNYKAKSPIAILKQKVLLNKIISIVILNCTDKLTKELYASVDVTNNIVILPKIKDKKVLAFKILYDYFRNEISSI